MQPELCQSEKSSFDRSHETQAIRLWSWWQEIRENARAQSTHRGSSFGFDTVSMQAMHQEVQRSFRPQEVSDLFEICFPTLPQFFFRHMEHHVRILQAYKKVRKVQPMPENCSDDEEIETKKIRYCFIDKALTFMLIAISFLDTNVAHVVKASFQNHHWWSMDCFDTPMPNSFVMLALSASKLKRK